MEIASSLVIASGWEMRLGIVAKGYGFLFIMTKMFQIIEMIPVQLCKCMYYIYI